MAFSFEASGFQYNPLAPRLEGSPLAGLKPIQIPQQSPVQIAPVPAWQVPNLPMPPRAEGLASSITGAVNAIGQGIVAAYKAKREDEKDLMKAKMASDLKTAEHQETLRHHLELERAAKERMKSVLPPDYGDRSEEDATYAPMAPTAETPSEPSSTLNDLQLPSMEKYKRETPIKAGSFESINLPEEETAPAGGINIFSKPLDLSSITSPVPLEAAPTQTGEDALASLKNIDWSKVSGNYVASTTGLAPITDIPTQQPDWLRKPQAVTAPLATMGGLHDGTLDRVEGYLADTEKALAQREAQAAPQVIPSGAGVPKAAFKTYEQARRYMESQASNPNWYAEGTPKPDKFGNFIIPWKQSDPAVRAAREEAQKTREQTAKSTEQNRMENTILRESRAFGLQKPVANFLRQGGTKELMLPFIAAYENSNKHPEAAGQAEVDMIDLLGRAMSGGKITVGQTQLIENAMSLKDKYLTKMKGKAYGGGFLPEPIKQQMVRTFTETYNYGADAANKVVTATKQRLSTSGIPAEKAGVYYFVGGHRPDTEVMLKSDALERIKQGRQEIANLVAEKAKAKPEDVDLIDKKIEAIKTKSKILHDRLLDESDVDSLLLGAKKLQDINLPEGFGGGDVGQVEVVPQ